MHKFNIMFCDKKKMEWSKTVEIIRFIQRQHRSSVAKRINLLRLFLFVELPDESDRVTR